MAAPNWRWTMLKFYYNGSPNPDQGRPVPRGGRAALRGDPRRHAQGRAVQARVPGHQSERQGAGHRRWRRHRIRQQRDPALSRRKDRQVPARDTPAGARRAAVLADVRRDGVGPVLGPGRAFPALRSRAGALCRQPLQFEAERHCGILDARLAKQRYMVGDTYTIVDMAVWGWARIVPFILGEDAWAELPNLKRLFDEIGARPAAQRATRSRTATPSRPRWTTRRGAHMFPQNARLAS